MKDELTDEQNAAIIKSLNEAISRGPWDKSNFLKVIGKSLKETQDIFLAQLGGAAHSKFKAQSDFMSPITLRADQQEVYVSLYCYDGANLQSWEKIIVNLPRQMISRPIYANEEEIKVSIKSKENKQNEAYVAICINKSDILDIPSDKMAVDKLGKALLSLKDKSLAVNNISRFVHLGNTYRYEKNHLIKIL